ncbi:transposase [Alkalinema sp. FACHB-956]|uniref:transposase n=1 Tax=Alkalinema sp. FACHB-956 TaxID=2692768 RepID=UPI001682E8E1|nr:transposase [Alkalinema sp. FACHB-956]MBD2325418.1 transposase [Alkalinema sp. FACHB-956]
MLPTTHEECIRQLEQIRWGGQHTCPYCGSTKATAYKKELRYRCNDCFTSYSVTVGTLFHRTHVDLHVWFKAIYLIFNSPKKVTIHGLANELKVNKNTACSMLAKIDKARETDRDFLQKLIDDLNL